MQTLRNIWKDNDKQIDRQIDRLPYVQMKDTGPDKGEQTACEVTNESHEDREVGDDHSEHDG